MSLVFQDGYRYLISNFERYTQILEKARRIFLKYGIDDHGITSNSHLQVPLWLHCKCGSKASIRIEQSNHNRILSSSPVVGTCMSCKRKLRITIDTKSDRNFGKDLQNLTPKAIAILLLLSRDLGISCYSSGTGAIAYTAYASIVCAEFGIKMPFTIFWPARDIIFGIGQTKALDTLQLKNHDEIVMYLKLLKHRHDRYKHRIVPILRERTRLIVNSKENRMEQEIKCVLSDLFRLKEKQREINRRIKLANKVKNALELRPSILDYAINFGITETERQWRNNLIRKDNLADPVIISNNSIEF
jgi:hypothetical protein